MDFKGTPVPAAGSGQKGAGYDAADYDVGLQQSQRQNAACVEIAEPSSIQTSPFLSSGHGHDGGSDSSSNLNQPLLPLAQRPTRAHSSGLHFAGKRQRHRTIATTNSSNTAGSSGSSSASNSSRKDTAATTGGRRLRRLLQMRAVLAACSAAVGLLLGAWAVLSVQHLHTQVRCYAGHSALG